MEFEEYFEAEGVLRAIGGGHSSGCLSLQGAREALSFVGQTELGRRLTEAAVAERRLQQVKEQEQLWRYKVLRVRAAHCTFSWMELHADQRLVGR